MSALLSAALVCVLAAASGITWGPAYATLPQLATVVAAILTGGALLIEVCER